jgi:large subunit ribosomal protein L15
MKLHDLQPAEGSRRARTRVGRGIAAGKGKTAGRGTKGQKARAGASIPAWFEGGQTPLQMRIPKLRGFRNPFKIEYEVVNVGRIADAIERGRIEAVATGAKSKKQPPLTVNQEILREAGLVRTLNRPLKVLGAGEVTRPLFVVADAFTRSAVAKIEAAGGTAQVIEMPTGQLAALGLEEAVEAAVAGKAKAPPVEDVSEPASKAALEPAPAEVGETVEAAAAEPEEAEADEAAASGSDA